MRIKMLRKKQWFCLSLAAFKGHLGVLKFLHEEKCPTKEWICNDAAQGGHIHCLEWLTSKGFALHADTCAYAAEAGHKHVIQWLRSKGCPWNSNCFAAAVISGNHELMNWLEEEGCPGSRLHNSGREKCECCGEPISSSDHSDSESDYSDLDDEVQAPVVQIVVHTSSGALLANSGAMLAHFLGGMIGPGFPFARPEGEGE